LSPAEESPKRGLGIGNRLIIACVGLYFTAACLITIIEALSVSATIRKSTEAEIASLAATFVPTLNQAFWNFDDAIVELVLRGLVENQAVGRAELRDERGKLVAALDKGEAVAGSGRAGATPAPPAGPASPLGPGRAFPLFHAAKGREAIPLGTLVLYPFLLAERERVLATVTMGTWRTLAIVVLLSAILALAIERFLGRPLRELAREVSSIDPSGPGGAEYRPLPEASGELLLVGRAFEAMAGRVGATVAELREGERRWRSFFEDSPISIWEEDFSAVRRRVEEARSAGVSDWAEYFSPIERVRDCVGLVKVLDVNRATLKLLGYPDKEGVLESLTQVFGPDEASALRPELVALATGRGSYEGESAYRGADGRLVHVQFKLSLVPGYEDSWARVLVSVMDLSGRKRVEEALRGSEAKYRGLVEQSSEGIMLLDAEGTIVDCNPVIEGTAGRGREGIVGRKVWDLEYGLGPGEPGGGEYRAMLEGKWRAALEGGEDGREPFEAIFERPDGARRVFEWTLFPISTEVGLKYGSILRDVTEQRDAARSLMESLREKELLLQEVHHRVKNNLQVICSLINLQQYESGDSADAGRSLLDMEARVRSMALVHELLYQSEDFALVDFSSYVGQLCDHLLSAYLEDPGRVRLAVSIEEVSLSLDKAIPCGLLINELVVNALKHAFPGDRPGTIEVAMRRLGDGRVSLTVSDDGTGTAADGIEEGGRKTIGLSLVRSLASQLGGVYDSESAAGTRVSIAFPA
jgi:PAS domain S-box-containing protein